MYARSNHVQPTNLYKHFFELFRKLILLQNNKIMNTNLKTYWLTACQFRTPQYAELWHECLGLVLYVTVEIKLNLLYDVIVKRSAM